MFFKKSVWFDVIWERLYLHDVFFYIFSESSYFQLKGWYKAIQSLLKFRWEMATES